MRGALGQVLAEIAAAKGRVSETELQIIQIAQDLHNEVNKELRETAERIAEIPTSASVAGALSAISDITGSLVR